MFYYRDDDSGTRPAENGTEHNRHQRLQSENFPRGKTYYNHRHDETRNSDIGGFIERFFDLLDI